MDRRGFIAGTLSLLVAPLAGEAQPAAKVVRIGMLWTASPDNPLLQAVFDAFQQGLREQGYVAGKDVAFEHRSAREKYELFPDLAAELVRLNVNVIVTGNALSTLAAKQATSTIPIVFAAAPDPVAAGLVASLARPGGNVTGLTTLVSPAIVGKQLELLKEAVPKLSRVAVLGNPASLHTRMFIREAETAARSLKVQLQIVEARDPDEFKGAFAAVTKERVGAMFVLSDPMFINNRTQLVNLAARNRLPTMYAQREHVEAGGLMAYASNLAELYRRAATYVGKILKGAKPADLPVEQPTKFELVINLKTAKALGLTIPQSLLLRADEVIR